ncbi:MAG: hypothetical protein JRN52_14115 [Nitrososphaerota archaeon]|nr:hypothetical protein [Nitrososphaerota archaeon]
MNKTQGNVILVGHVVIDEIIDYEKQTKPRISLGGGVTYGSIALLSLGYKASAVTKVGRDFPPEFHQYLRNYVNFELPGSESKEKTTRYRIDRSTEPRKLWLRSRCAPISISDLRKALTQNRNRYTIVLNPVAGEVSQAIVRDLCGSHNLAMDSQGFVRRVKKKDFLVTSKKIRDISFLEGVELLKADARELRAWTGESDVESSVLKLSRYLKSLLISSGAGSVRLYEGGRIKAEATPYPVQVKDTTGAGDILLACYVAKYRETRDVKEALAFSVSAATLAVQQVGIEKAVLDPNEVTKTCSKVRIQS